MCLTVSSQSFVSLSFYGCLSYPRACRQTSVHIISLHDTNQGLPCKPHHVDGALHNAKAIVSQSMLIKQDGAVP